MRKSFFPILTGLTFRVWQRNMFHFRKTWRVNLVWIVVEPMVYLLAFGYGLGGLVSHINSQSYVEFFFPGLLCTTAMMVSFFESTYGNFVKLTQLNTYSTLLLTKLSVDEIICGEVLWATSKALIGVSIVGIMGSLFGIGDPWVLLKILPYLFFVAWFFANLGMWITAGARNYDSFIYPTSVMIIPLTFLSGAYYPLSQLPNWVRILAYSSPLTQAVSASRAVADESSWMTVVALTVSLFILGIVMFGLALRRMSGRILK